jgi:hypothetical protein
MFLLLIFLKRSASHPALRCCSMATFVYQCPATGQNVQGWILDDGHRPECDTYRTFTCIACGGMHLVNPSTGKVLSGDDEKETRPT